MVQKFAKWEVRSNTQTNIVAKSAVLARRKKRAQKTLYKSIYEAEELMRLVVFQWLYKEEREIFQRKISNITCGRTERRSEHTLL